MFIFIDKYIKAKQIKRWGRPFGAGEKYISWYCKSRKARICAALVLAIGAVPELKRRSVTTPLLKGITKVTGGIPR